MELANITLRFDTPEEQEFYEKNLNLSIYDKETFEADDPKYSSWTEFDISGCEPADIKEMLEEVAKKWENLN